MPFAWKVKKKSALSLVFQGDAYVYLLLPVLCYCKEVHELTLLPILCSHRMCMRYVLYCTPCSTLSPLSIPTGL